ncbi:hypothetical protein, partial [Marinitoga sp. 38H-ov]|uniref:hypothetical protein n=1 Tax=Marinitoga sp. 38H-ov TaxID=1755814 RepID=UPI0013EA3E2D
SKLSSYEELRWDLNDSGNIITKICNKYLRYYLKQLLIILFLNIKDQGKSHKAAVVLTARKQLEVYTICLNIPYNHIELSQSSKKMVFLKDDINNQLSIYN